MDYERSTSTLAKNAKQVTLIWGNDGWCYIPELKMRQRFTEKKYYREEWDGVIAIPEYIEQVTWAVHSKEPLIWQENEEVYSLKASNQKGHKSKQIQQALRQQLQRP